MDYKPDSYYLNVKYDVNIMRYEDRAVSSAPCTKLNLAGHSNMTDVGKQLLPKSIDLKVVSWYYRNRYGEAKPVSSSVTLFDLTNFPFFGYNQLRKQFDLFFSVGTAPPSIDTMDSGSTKVKLQPQVESKQSDRWQSSGTGGESKIAPCEDRWDELLNIQKLLPDRD